MRSFPAASCFMAIWQTGCIAGAVLGVLAGILLESFAAGCIIVMLVIVAAVFLIQLIHAMQSALILGQLGDGFLDALRKAFGPQPEHKQWPMSNELVRRSGLFPEEWESASARGSYEGSYQGIPFAMHNASLTHVWEVRDPMPDDPNNTRTCSKTIFKGLFLVCRMRRPVAQEAFVLPGSPRPGFGPELENWEQQLRRAVDARELRMSFRGDLMFAAFVTDRQIMAVSKDIDPKIIEEYRRSFQDSVDLMKGLMEAVAQNTELF